MAPDSAESLPWRIKALEERATNRDAIINRMSDRLDDTNKKLDRMAIELVSLLDMAKEARDESHRLAKVLDDESTRKRYAKEADEARARWWSKFSSVAWAVVSMISIGVAIVGGFLGSAWDQLTTLLKGLR